ncbi:unnamed protein product [Ilex paraguariensis]|uniref:Uncharacterized protein n=1 Tax=Ilex paraguariensis TaxID=185542 RepID=A0ABC8U3P2_9AQUA
MATLPKVYVSVAATAPTPTVAPETLKSSQKLDSPSIRVNLNPLSVSDFKSEETKQGNAVVKKENGIANEESKQRSIAELHKMLSGSKAQIKEQPCFAFETEQNQQKMQEVLGTKMLTTFVSNGNQTKAVLSPPQDKNTVSESHQEPAIFNREQTPLHREIRDNISKFVHKMTVGHQKYPMEKKLTSVITLAGKNRGASMHLGSESAVRKKISNLQRL